MSIRDVVYGIGKRHAGTELHVIVGETTAAFWSTSSGELVAEQTLPAPGTKHVGYVRKNPTPGQTPPTPEVSPRS
ncbi:hypothetical protein [Propioniciclava flava]|uniref:Uncharacterized protein n=1 Tax=Propioniciclava flava TaxID=2072026 RepID=A0A4Q2EL88_9ACTN|nr:hypothetical protein [Propioniciclava flava]RXW33546.1 hypothetical protein C1706_01990 [Propioniciclava flava]